MAEHNGIVKCALDEITTQWKNIGGAVGLARTVVKGILVNGLIGKTTVLAVIVYFPLGVGFADYFLGGMVLIGNELVNTPFAVVLYAYRLAHVLAFLVGLTNVPMIHAFDGRRNRLSSQTFAIAFIGIAAQIAFYICLVGIHAVLALVWSPAKESAAGQYERYVLTLGAGKAPYLFLIKYEFYSFLEATKKAHEDDEAYAEAEDKANGTVEEDEDSENAAEKNDHSEEHAEPETSESGVTDWEIE